MNNNWNYIVDPKTKRTVSLTSLKGTKILKKYRNLINKKYGGNIETKPYSSDSIKQIKKGGGPFWGKSESLSFRLEYINNAPIQQVTSVTPSLPNRVSSEGSNLVFKIKFETHQDDETKKASRKKKRADRENQLIRLKQTLQRSKRVKNYFLERYRKGFTDHRMKSEPWNNAYLVRKINTCTENGTCKIVRGEPMKIRFKLQAYQTIKIFCWCDHTRMGTHKSDRVSGMLNKITQQRGREKTVDALDPSGNNYSFQDFSREEFEYTNSEPELMELQLIVENPTKNIHHTGFLGVGKYSARVPADEAHVGIVYNIENGGGDSFEPTREILIDSANEVKRMWEEAFNELYTYLDNLPVQTIAYHRDINDFDFIIDLSKKLNYGLEHFKDIKTKYSSIQSEGNISTSEEISYITTQEEYILKYISFIGKCKKSLESIPLNGYIPGTEGKIEGPVLQDGLFKDLPLEITSDHKIVHCGDYYSDSGDCWNDAESSSSDDEEEMEDDGNDADAQDGPVPYLQDSRDSDDTSTFSSIDSDDDEDEDSFESMSSSDE